MLVEKKVRWPLGEIFELPTWLITTPLRPDRGGGKLHKAASDSIIGGLPGRDSSQGRIRIEEVSCLIMLDR
jgi:hypothetical protein